MFSTTHSAPLAGRVRVLYLDPFWFKSSDNPTAASVSKLGTPKLSLNRPGVTVATLVTDMLSKTVMVAYTKPQVLSCPSASVWAVADPISEVRGC
jgi:hypothetical protein